jgi:hypothetical protein
VGEEQLMAIALACPTCRAEFKVRDALAGRQIKCPGCSMIVLVPARGHDDQTEARPPKKSGMNMALLIGLGIGCGALFLLLLTCGIGAGVIWYLGRSELNSNVTQANYDKLQPGMTLAQVEAILGPGKAAGSDDVPDLPNGGPMVPSDGGTQELRQNANQGRVYRWKNSQTNSVLFASFSGRPSQDSQAETFLFAIVRDKSFEACMKGKNFGRQWSQTRH